MRIAYVCADPGVPVFGTKGASVHAKAVLQVFVDSGHDVHLVTPRPGGDPMPGVVIHELPPVPKGAAAERELAAQASDLHAEDILEQLGPDLVYERYSLWGRAAMQWAKARGVASILEVNAPLVEEQIAHRELVDRDRAQAVAVATLSAASAAVCVSVGVSKWARAVSAHPERVHTIANGVDVDRIGPPARAVTHGNADAFTIGFVGTLKPWHGVDVLLEAFEELVGQDPTWRLLLVGDGPRGEALRSHVRAAGLSQLVEMTGALPNGQVVDQLHRMDVACAPYPPQEPFYFSPLKIYEYLAAGLPVVASGIGQCPEALDRGSLGMLVPPGDARALATALSDLRYDTRRREYLRVATRLVAVERHTWTDVVDRTLRLAGSGVLV